MPQARNSDQDEISLESSKSSLDLSRMMREGRSFSSHERNCFFLNTGATPAAEGRFANISAISGLDFPDDGRALALVDWDHDGDLDMWISNRNAPRLRLMRNDSSTSNHFLALRLQGNGNTTNRDAIGARVEIVTDETNRYKLVKTLRAGEGFLAQSSKWLHFGLGSAQSIEKVIVHWPGEKTEEFSDVQLDRRYRLIQGTGIPQDDTQAPRKTKLAPSDQKVLPPSRIARIPLVPLLKMPDCSFGGFDGREHFLSNSKGQPVLINLWSSTCIPCLKELDELAKRHAEIRAKGLKVIALSVDGLKENSSDLDKAASLVYRKKYPFMTGQASLQLARMFQNLNDRHFALHRRLPLPASFLIDRQGRLAVIYKGPLSVDDLLRDLSHSDLNREQRFERAAPISGRMTAHPQLKRAAILRDVRLMHRLAVDLEKVGRLEESAAQFLDTLRVAPDRAEFHNNYGRVLEQQGKLSEAVKQYSEAIRLSPDFAISHNNLGNISQQRRNYEEAVEHYLRAVEIYPDYAEAHRNLGSALHRLGRLEKAVERYEKALHLKSNFAPAHSSLGFALFQLKRPEEALKHFKKAAELQPDNISYRINLGRSLEARKQFEEAVIQFGKALQLKPDNANALNHLAWLKATCPNPSVRNGTKAVEYAEHAARISKYQNPIYLDTLSASYAEIGAFEKAVKWQKKAIELAKGQQKGDFEERLKLYVSGTPFRDAPAKQKSE